jgi:transposase
MAQRRPFTAKVKTRVVLELLTGTKRMAQPWRDYALKDQVVYRWKAAFRARAETIFGGDIEHQHLQQRIVELERLVGRLTLELEVAKKAAPLWRSRSPRKGR